MGRHCQKHTWRIFQQKQDSQSRQWLGRRHLSRTACCSTSGGREGHQESSEHYGCPFQGKSTWSILPSPGTSQTLVHSDQLCLALRTATKTVATPISCPLPTQQLHNLLNKHSYKHVTYSKTKLSKLKFLSLIEHYLGDKCLHPSILDIPTKLSHAPSGSSHGITIVAEVVQVVLVVCSLVQPCSSPKQLVLHTPIS